MITRRMENSKNGIWGGHGMRSSLENSEWFQIISVKNMWGEKEELSLGKEIKGKIITNKNINRVERRNHYFYKLEASRISGLPRRMRWWWHEVNIHTWHLNILLDLYWFIWACYHFCEYSEHWMHICSYWGSAGVSALPKVIQMAYKRTRKAS